MAADHSVSQITADIVCEFLEVSIHNILYVRELYPAGVFERKKKYHVPVQVSCHPEVNQYIADLVQSLKPLLDKGQIYRVDVVIMNADQTPAERFVFEIAPPSAGTKEHEIRSDTYLIRLEQALRAFLLKLNISDSLLQPISKDCTWTIQVHTKESSVLEMQEKELIQDFTWVPAEGSSLRMSNPKLMPLKAADTELLKMQLYVEESGDKG